MTTRFSLSSVNLAPRCIHEDFPERVFIIRELILTTPYMTALLTDETAPIGQMTAACVTSLTLLSLTESEANLFDRAATLAVDNLRRSIRDIQLLVQAGILDHEVLVRIPAFPDKEHCKVVDATLQQLLFSVMASERLRPALHQTDNSPSAVAARNATLALADIITTEAKAKAEDETSSSSSPGFRVIHFDENGFREAGNVSPEEMHAILNGTFKI